MSLLLIILTLFSGRRSAHQVDNSRSRAPRLYAGPELGAAAAAPGMRRAGRGFCREREGGERRPLFTARFRMWLLRSFAPCSGEQGSRGLNTEAVRGESAAPLMKDGAPPTVTADFSSARFSKGYACRDQTGWLSRIAGNRVASAGVAAHASLSRRGLDAWW